MLRTRPDDLGGARSPLQFGAELFGHAGPESDVEVICLMLAALERAGVDDLYLDIGHVGVFRGLAAQAGLTPAQEGALFEALQRKSEPEVNGLLGELALSGDIAVMLGSLSDLNGGSEVLAEARHRLARASGEVARALDSVGRLAERLNQLHPQLPVHFDFAELRGYGFHSGAVFAAFVPGHGQEIARGGRYDHIGEVFGARRPATGFSADLKTLLRFAATEDPVVPGDPVFAPAEESDALQQAIDDLRAEGRVVIRELPGQAGDAAAMGCTQRLVEHDGEWQLAPATAD